MRLRLLFIVLVLGICGGSSSNAQTSEGRIRYLVTKNYPGMMAGLDYISKTSKERITYLYGKDSWSYYTELYVTPHRSRYQDSEETVGYENYGYNGKKDVFQVSMNFMDSTMFHVFESFGKNYLISDSLWCPSWQILNDIKEVAGHLCMNAQWRDTVKGQEIRVWFALDIPISAGPEILCGLPGLILEADYNRGAMVLVADKLEWKPVEPEQINITRRYRGKKISWATYRRELEQLLGQQRKAEQPWFWSLRY